VGGSTGSTMQSTTADFADDVLAGVDYLKSRKEIDARKIGLIGHSEGGIIAPLVASRSPDVAFIVLLAVTGLPGEEVMYLQGAAILRAMGSKDKDLADERSLQEQIFGLVKREKDNDKAAKKLNELIGPVLAKMTDTEKESPDVKIRAEQQAKMVLTPWFRFFLTYDPRPALRQVKCPVLALNGEKDAQVPPTENLASIEAALKEGGNKSYTLCKLPGLNHLFQTCTTGALAEYAQIEETLAPAALQAVGDWIVKQTKQPRVSLK
jgi:pimeloyl-ACP methyl ester carboxylesterase